MFDLKVCLQQRKFSFFQIMFLKIHDMTFYLVFIERNSPLHEECDIKDVKPALPNLDCVSNIVKH